MTGELEPVAPHHCSPVAACCGLDCFAGWKYWLQQLQRQLRQRAPLCYGCQSSERLPLHTHSEQDRVYVGPGPSQGNPIYTALANESKEPTHASHAALFVHDICTARAILWHEVPFANETDASLVPLTRSKGRHLSFGLHFGFSYELGLATWLRELIMIIRPQVHMPDSCLGAKQESKCTPAALDSPRTMRGPGRPLLPPQPEEGGPSAACCACCAPLSFAELLLFGRGRF